MMNVLFKKCVLLAVLFLLSACVADHSDRRLQTNARIAVPYESGAIFKAGVNERPLFEERRARNIGDGIIMNVVEVAPAKKPDAKDKAAKDNANADGESRKDRRRSEEDGGDLTNITNEALLGPVAMTVIDVLDNGYLLVTGGRQVTVDEDEQYLRVTGVVDPANLVNGNTIQSSQVSEVRIQIDHVRIRADGTSSNVNEGNSVFGNYFQSVRPR
jgi:flagellar L-ring protein precursor FlgH